MSNNSPETPNENGAENLTEGMEKLQGLREGDRINFEGEVCIFRENCSDIDCVIIVPANGSPKAMGKEAFLRGLNAEFGLVSTTKRDLIESLKAGDTFFVGKTEYTVLEIQEHPAPIGRSVFFENKSVLQSNSQHPRSNRTIAALAYQIDRIGQRNETAPIEEEVTQRREIFDQKYKKMKGSFTPEEVTSVLNHAYTEEDYRLAFSILNQVSVYQQEKGMDTLSVTIGAKIIAALKGSNQKVKLAMEPSTTNNRNYPSPIRKWLAGEAKLLARY